MVMSELFAYKHIRFLGAAGIGMTALIQILEDLRKSSLIDPELKISCSDLSYEHNDLLSDDIDLVVRSTAISEQDPELIELRARGVEVWHRSDMLAYLSSFRPSLDINEHQTYKQIVVTGTHGKTTCSAMLAHVLEYAGLDPSYAIGGVLLNYGRNAKSGRGEFFVLEGDESDKSYLKSSPYLTLLTYIEPDHLENYPGGFEEIQNCFLAFLEKSTYKIICLDDPILAEYFNKVKTDTKTFSYSSSLISSQVNPRATFHIDIESKNLSQNLATNSSESSSWENLAKLELLMQGRHNLVNACAVLTAAYALGVSVDVALKALAEFRGIKRRFELINDSYSTEQAKRITVYDDYAHHPSELAALIAGVLAMKPKRLVLVYQPHHPERTQQLWGDFVAVLKSFPQEHLLLLADIYVARSANIPGINSARMAQEVGLEQVRYLSPIETSLDSQANYKDIVAAFKPSIDALLRDDDVLLIAGAGNIAKLAQGFAVKTSPTKI